MLERIAGVQFRCLQDYALEFPPGISLFAGDNGAGKTSILESIYLLGRGRSFRTANLAHVATTGTQAFSLRGQVYPEDGAMRRLALRWVEGRCTGQVDGRAADGLTELARLFPVEIIDTQVQEIVRGGPGERRRFMDWGVFHVEHAFLTAWRRYQRALKQRNAALRAGARAAVLAPWEDELVEQGEVLDGARRRYASQLAEGLQDVGEDLVEAGISISYHQGWAEALSLAEALARSRERDLQRGVTGVGPHRADLEIRLGSRGAREHASGGQQKLIACALVLAQVRLVGETLGESPLLLIDDPGAEIADTRLDRLMGWVEGLCGQVFVTGLSAEVLGGGADALFHVEQGRVTRVK